MAQEKTAPEKSHREQQLAEFDSVLQHTKAYEMAVPDGIKEWLGRALLLYGVPFNYLVPDPRMLPPESIRFFHLDPGWVYRLLEGACSVGRTTSREQVIDQELGNRFLREAPAAAAQVRPAARESADGEPRPPAKVPEVQWPLTGFLLRSRVVEGWQGLEMTATGTQGVETAVKQLEPLRIDRLGPDTMLCIFNGKVTRIVVKQPPEGMHFGADPIPNSKRFEKGGLRRVDRSGNAEPGDYAQAAKVDNVPMRGDDDNVGVVEVKKLADEIGEQLRRAKLMSGPQVTSAEFALQMVSSPGKVTFAARTEASQDDDG